MKKIGEKIEASVDIGISKIKVAVTSAQKQLTAPKDPVDKLRDFIEKTTTAKALLKQTGDDSAFNTNVEDTACFMLVVEKFPQDTAIWLRQLLGMQKHALLGQQGLAEFKAWLRIHPNAQQSLRQTTDPESVLLIADLLVDPSFPVQWITDNHTHITIGNYPTTAGRKLVEALSLADFIKLCHKFIEPFLNPNTNNATSHPQATAGFAKAGAVLCGERLVATYEIYIRTEATAGSTSKDEQQHQHLLKQELIEHKNASTLGMRLLIHPTQIAALLQLRSVTVQYKVITWLQYQSELLQENFSRNPNGWSSVLEAAPNDFFEDVVNYFCRLGNIETLAESQSIAPFFRTALVQAKKRNNAAVLQKIASTFDPKNKPHFYCVLNQLTATLDDCLELLTLLDKHAPAVALVIFKRDTHKHKQPSSQSAYCGFLVKLTKIFCDSTTIIANIADETLLKLLPDSKYTYEKSADFSTLCRALFAVYQQRQKLAGYTGAECQLLHHTLLNGQQLERLYIDAPGDYEKLLEDFLSVSAIADVSLIKALLLSEYARLGSRTDLHHLFNRFIARLPDDFVTTQLQQRTFDLMVLINAPTTRGMAKTLAIRAPTAAYQQLEQHAGVKSLKVVQCERLFDALSTAQVIALKSKVTDSNDHNAYLLTRIILEISRGSLIIDATVTAFCHEHNDDLWNLLTANQLSNTQTLNALANNANLAALFSTKISSQALTAHYYQQQHLSPTLLAKILTEWEQLYNSYHNNYRYYFLTPSTPGLVTELRRIYNKATEKVPADDRELNEAALAEIRELLTYWQPSGPMLLGLPTAVQTTCNSIVSKLQLTASLSKPSRTITPPS